MAIGKTPYDILAEYREKIETALIESLKKNGRYASGTFAQSIEVLPPKVFGQSISIKVYMDEYWKFIERGVNGTQSKVGSEYSFKKKNLKSGVMQKHIAVRGKRYQDVLSDMMKTYKDKDGNIKTRKKPITKQKAAKSLAFILGRNISKRGLAPTNFVEEGIVGIERQLEADLLEAVGRQIEVQLTVLDK